MTQIEPLERALREICKKTNDPVALSIAGEALEIASQNYSGSRRAHKVMTAEEYAEMPISGWHEVCRDVDGFGGVGIRFLGQGVLK